MNHLKSLREFLSALEQHQELVRITREVDPNLEIGAICRRCYETGAPAPLFENIKGFLPGYRVLGAPGGISSQAGLYLIRVALALGLPANSTGRSIVEALVSARSRAGIMPRIVSSGPCKENKQLNDDIDVMQLPAPLLHDGDGGRYLNTFGLVCVQTPDKKWTNWSIARVMLVGRVRMAGIVAPNQHVGMVRKQWTDLGQDMPFALALGVEPFLPFVGGMPLPAYVDEADFAGAYFGEPIDVVRCETVDLCVPATAEIVVEGVVSLTETAPEGPMGEYAGYLWTGPGSPMPVYKVTAVTHRMNPILPVSVAGEPVEENHTAWGIPNAAEIVHVLREARLPVATAWTPFESANHWYVLAMETNWRQEVKMTSEQLCRRIGEVLLETKAGMGTPKYLVLNDDIDITNLKEVVWAFATRNYPGSGGEVIFNEESVNPLVAYLKPGEKMSFHTTKVIYNCLPPDLMTQLPKRSSFQGTYPVELQAHVLRSWKEYGF
jgi:UbiD family decarboxylase